MPYLETANSWLTQSTLLIQARPTTTRITTKYTLSRPTSNPPSSSTTHPSVPLSNKPEPPRANLTLKTYDPVSGTTLKYTTTKAAEVSRLIQILGRLARPMAGLPEIKEDAAVTGADGEVGSGPGTPAVEKEVSVIAGGGAGKSAAQGGAGAGGSGGKKGKKKGGKK